MIYLVNASPNRNGNSFKLGHFFLRDRDYEALQLVDYHIELLFLLNNIIQRNLH